MNNRGLLLTVGAIIGFMFLTVAFASETKVGNLTIIDQNIRATVPTAKVAAGYLTIRNDGTEPDILLGATVAFAGKVEVHEMKVTDGVMRMRPLADGLVIPSGKTVILKSGAEHLMFMKLSEPMTEGDMHKVTLRFAIAGEVELMFPVGNISGGHSGHTH